MADNYITPSFFFANDPNLNANATMRQRIAYAMLAKQRKLPTTIGEGLGAIGDALGDIGTERRLLAADRALQAEAMGAPPPPDAPQPRAASYAADDAVKPPADDEPATSKPTGTPYPREDTLTTSAVQPSSMLSPSTPTGLTAPQATLRDLRSPTPAPASKGPGPAALSEEEGGYNVIDAQAGTNMKPAPGYMRDAIARAVSDPDMQAYYGNLAARESPRPGMVSSTGARGPFQFVPGTAKQYGLGNPDDPDASVRAAQQLTADNAAAFQRINGRPPTLADLAVMHQQGGTTGANMIAGTGNAPARNLAVNNINPAAGPAQAVQGIKNFYGAPERTVGPAGPMRPMAFDGTPTATPPAVDAVNALAAGGSQAALPPATAPVQGPQIRQAPQPQISQVPRTPYVMPDMPTPVAPKLIPPSAREQQLIDHLRPMLMNGNPYAAQSPAAQELRLLEASRAYEQNRQNEAYKEQLQAKRAWDLKQQDQKAAAPKTAADIAHIEAQTRAAMLQEIDGKMVMGPDGIYRPPQVAGVAGNLPTAKLNEADKKSVNFYSQMRLMEEQLKGKEEILANGLRDEALGKTPFIGNALMRRQYRMAKNAAETWVDQYNILQTGAASRDIEWDRRLANTMPRYGDDAAQIQRKREAREGIMRSLYMGLGTQGARSVADAAVKDNMDRMQATRDSLNDEMSAKFPNAKKGEKKSRMKNGRKETRIFDGKNWIEAAPEDG